VAEEGTNDELIARGGVYAELHLTYRRDHAMHEMSVNA
jgi:hypothetical protein